MKKFIKGAIKHPGSLRAEAMREKLIKGKEKLTEADLNVLEEHAKSTKDQHLLHQVNLARTLMGMHKKS